MTILKNVGAVLLGMFLGGVANMGLILVSWQIWPPPEGFDMNDQAQLADFVGTLPAAAFAFVMVAHLAQALVGGWIAARLAASRPRVLAMIVAVLTLVGGVMNLTTLPAPAWMWLEVPLYLVVGWFVGDLEARRRAALPTA